MCMVMHVSMCSPPVPRVQLVLCRELLLTEEADDPEVIRLKSLQVKVAVKGHRGI
jgi:hypothetical protein